MSGEQPRVPTAVERRARLSEQQARGEQARAVLANPLVTEAFATVEADIMRRWQESQAHETEQRENAYVLWRGMQTWRGYFQKLVRDGEHAGRELKQMQEGKTDAT